MLQDFIAYLSEEKKVSLSTLKSYIRDIKQLQNYFFTLGMDDITKTSSVVLENYIKHLRTTDKALSTIQRNVVSIKCYYAFLQSRGIIANTPAQNLSIKNSPAPEVDAPTDNEIALLLEQPVCIDFKGLRDKSMLELLYATGMRVSELIEIKTNDLFLKDSYVICGQKAKRRIIPIGAKAQKALQSYLDKARFTLIVSDSDYLFLNTKGGQLSRQGFWKIIKYYSKKAHISQTITPHTLRHCFAMHLLENGADEGSVKKMMGHSNIGSTKAYSKAIKAKLSKVYNAAHPRA